MPPNNVPQRNFNAIGNSAVAVSPSDTVDLPFDAQALYIGTSGDLVVDVRGGQKQVLFANHPVGYMPVAVTRVWSSGTTASGIVGLY